MIRGKNVYLRLVREDDLAALSSRMSDLDAAGEFWPMYFMTEPALRNRYMEDGYWSERFGRLLICGADDRVLGEIFYFKTVEYLDELEIAYRIFSPEDRGQGTGAEALGLLTQFLFASRPVHRLRLMIDPGNVASKRVAEKCGYRYEGTARGCMYHHGRYHDMDVFGILRHEGLPGDS